MKDYFLHYPVQYKKLSIKHFFTQRKRSVKTLFIVTTLLVVLGGGMFVMVKKDDTAKILEIDTELLSNKYKIIPKYSDTFKYYQRSFNEGITQSGEIELTEKIERELYDGQFQDWNTYIEGNLVFRLPKDYVYDPIWGRYANHEKLRRSKGWPEGTIVLEVNDFPIEESAEKGWQQKKMDVPLGEKQKLQNGSYIEKLKVIEVSGVEVSKVVETYDQSKNYRIQYLVNNPFQKRFHFLELKVDSTQPFDEFTQVVDSIAESFRYVEPSKLDVQAKLEERVSNPFSNPQKDFSSVKKVEDNFSPVPHAFPTDSYWQGRSRYTNNELGIRTRVPKDFIIRESPEEGIVEVYSPHSVVNQTELIPDSWALIQVIKDERDASLIINDVESKLKLVNGGSFSSNPGLSGVSFTFPGEDRDTHEVMISKRGDKRIIIILSKVGINTLDEISADFELFTPTETKSSKKSDLSPFAQSLMSELDVSYLSPFEPKQAITSFDSAPYSKEVVVNDDQKKQYFPDITDFGSVKFGYEMGNVFMFPREWNYADKLGDISNIKEVNYNAQERTVQTLTGQFSVKIYADQSGNDMWSWNYEDAIASEVGWITYFIQTEYEKVEIFSTADKRKVHKFRSIDSGTAVKYIVEDSSMPGGYFLVISVDGGLIDENKETYIKKIDSIVKSMRHVSAIEQEI